MQNEEQTSGLNIHSPIVQRVLALRKGLSPSPQLLTEAERRRIETIHHSASVFPDEFPNQNEQGEKPL